VHLRAALESALADAPDLEVLVVFDRHQGGARPRLEPDPRVRLLDAQAPGPSGARNTGIDAARGEYVAFLDDDDAWLPGHLERARERFEADPSLSLFAADAYLWRDRTADGSAPLPERAHLPRFDPTGRSGPITLRDLLLANRVLTPTVVVRRASLGEADRFRGDLPVMEDYDLWLRLAARGSLWFDARASALVRKRRGGASRQRRQMAECAIRVLEPWLLTALSTGALTRKEIAVRLGRLWHDRAHACLIEGDRAEAARSARRSLAYLPLHVKNHIYLVVAALPSRWGAGLLRGVRALRGEADGGGP
jgi:hypothetical protein